MIGLILAPIVGGILYRQRGGGIKLPIHIGTQGARLIWSIPTGVFVGIICGIWWVGILSGIGVFLGLLFGHGGHQRSYFALENESPNWDHNEWLTAWVPYGENWGKWRKEIYHWFGMGFIQLVRIGLFISPGIWFAPELVWVLLSAFFPAYFIGWRIPSKIPLLLQGTEVGEFLTGFAIWAALGGIYYAY